MERSLRAVRSGEVDPPRAYLDPSHLVGSPSPSSGDTIFNLLELGMVSPELMGVTSSQGDLLGGPVGNPFQGLTELCFNRQSII